MSSALICKAHAKINLFLNLLGLRPDGFHEVRFVMQTLELADTLDIVPMGQGRQIDFHCDSPDLASGDNLVVKAYHLFYETLDLSPIALQVKLTKHIPVQAGLGGGSSDAAAMLKALNQLHGDIVPQETQHQLAGRLGSDVPFFLYGGTAVATGRGEQIKPVKSLLGCDVVLFKPRHIGIATPMAYQWVRERGQYQTQSFASWEAFLQDPHASCETLPTLLHNDFEPLVLARFESLQTAFDILKQHFEGVILSGSGPTLVGLLGKQACPQSVLEIHFPESEWHVIPTRFNNPS